MDNEVIIESIQKYVTKENITFLLGVFGSIGTFYALVSRIFLNRVKVELSIIEFVPAKDSVVLYVMFINKSHLPISIINVKLWNRSMIYECVKSPHIVRIDTRTSKNTVIYKEATYNIPFPINLPSLSGTSGYLYFQIPQGNFQLAPKSLTVEVNTNRHRKFQTILSLPENQ